MFSSPFFLSHRLVVPLIFKQYFVIHVMIGNKYIPCAYVYMSGKYEEADYDRVFAALKKIGIEHSSDGKGFNPSEMQCDFELVSQNSFKKCFPNAKIAPNRSPGVISRGRRYTVALPVKKRLKKL